MRKVVNGLGAVVISALVACGGDGPMTPEPAPQPEPAPEPATPTGPMKTILMVQAQFVKEDGKPKPGPAKLTLWRTDGEQWFDTIVEDPESNVFHKAMAWRDGILTIGAEGAKLKHWTKGEGDTWTAKTLWEQKWEGKFQRLRDLEIGDLDGDGEDEIALATHDMGVVAVGDENDDGTWTFAEFDKKADTFVHEVEIGDVDGDGKDEFYVTPSGRNKASGESQPGGVARYAKKGDGYERTMVVEWEESHAKEILVTDLDGDGRDELYIVKEGHVQKGKRGKARLVDPVKIVRADPSGGKFVETEVASIAGEKQCRFLLPADVDGDGKLDLIAAGMDTGLWYLTRDEQGNLSHHLVDANSGGFEHATHAVDLDGDGKVELYVASDKQQEFRRYVYNGAGFDKTVIAPIPPMHITWNLQDAEL